VIAPHELTEDSYGLVASGQPYQPGVRTRGDPLVGITGKKHGDMEFFGIEAGGNLARVPHLRVRQASVGEAVDKNADRLSGRRLCAGRRKTNLGLLRNAPILFEGRAVATQTGGRNPVTFEIPPDVFVRAAAVASG